MTYTACHEAHDDGNTTDAYRHTCGRCGGDRRRPSVIDTRPMTRDELADEVLVRLGEGTVRLGEPVGDALLNCLGLKCVADPSSRYAKALPPAR